MQKPFIFNKQTIVNIFCLLNNILNQNLFDNIDYSFLFVCFSFYSFLVKSYIYFSHLLNVYRNARLMRLKHFNGNLSCKRNGLTSKARRISSILFSFSLSSIEWLYASYCPNWRLLLLTINQPDESTMHGTFESIFVWLRCVHVQRSAPFRDLMLLDVSKGHPTNEHGIQK